MVLVFYKVFALVLKVFTKPLIEHTKAVHLRQKTGSTHPYLRRFFIKLGNKFSYYEQWINQKFLRIQSEYAFKPLNDELAIEKGISFFYELVFYSIILAIPLYQLNRASNESKENKKQLEERIKGLENRLTMTLKEIEIENQIIAKKRIIEHPWLYRSKKREEIPDENKKINKKTTYKIILQFPNKRTHIYHMDYLL